MSTRIIIGIISFCVALSGVVLANMFLIMMIGQVNRKRQDGNLVSYYWSTLPNLMQIFSEYRASYPSGRKHIYTWAAFAFAAIGFIGFLVCSRIIG